MESIWIITKKELNSFLDSMTGYILLVLFLGFSGFFTWLFGNDIFMMNEASLQVFFSWSYWTLFFFIPGLTMRSVAEEINSGTIELIGTKAISSGQMIAGKFLASWLLVMTALALTLPYYLTVSSLGKVDHGAVWGGYFGLILVSGAYISIGIFASSISKNQIIAFLTTLFIGIFFQFIFDLISKAFFGLPAAILSYLSVFNHYSSLLRGVFDLRDIIFFISLIATGLFLGNYMVSRRLLTE